MRAGWLWIVNLCAAVTLKAQDDSVMYSKDFTFRDGIYMNFYDFRSNAPVPPSRIISNYDKKSIDFLKQELNKTEIKYLDSSGKEQTVRTGKLWGYCSNNSVYINYGKEFARIPVIGSICHFTAFAQVVLGGYGPYTNTPYDMRSGYQEEQFMLDTHTGKVTQFSSQNLAVILARDEALYKEYTALSKKKKKQLTFFYLRKFNEKHPLYFRP